MADVTTDGMTGGPTDKMTGGGTAAATADCPSDGSLRDTALALFRARVRETSPKNRLRFVVNLLPSLIGLGLARIGKADRQWDSTHAMWVCTGQARRWAVKGGTTYGNTFVTPFTREYIDSPRGQALLRHESIHRNQWALLGFIIMPIAYGIAYAIQGEHNTFEKRAGLADGGYIKRAGPLTGG
ncbi:MAG: hypothetical protein LBB54_05555 [Cellulomonadaceae bacterium]|jgi:hypothetical protein|nr:hypothetical protein [Cellulomonadaceae bacterium]